MTQTQEPRGCPTPGACSAITEIERMQTEFAYLNKLAAEDHDMLQRQCDRYEAHIMALEERIRKAHTALGIIGGEIG